MGQALSSDYSNVDIVNRSLSSKKPCFLVEPLGAGKSQSSLKFVETDEEKSSRLDNLARKSSGSCMKDRIDYLIEGYLLSNKPLDSLSVMQSQCKSMEISKGQVKKEACPPSETTPDGEIESPKNLSPPKNDEDTEEVKKEDNTEKRAELESVHVQNGSPQNGDSTGILKSENIKPNLTLQTFIDKVLDTSLSIAEKTETDSKTSFDTMNNSSLDPKTKNIDNALKMPKAPENRGRMSLQDRIEQVLEQTFNTHSSEEEEKKLSLHKTSMTKNSTDSAFNPQDLVDKMINQSEVINKLLSPSKEQFDKAQKMAGDTCGLEKTHVAMKKGFPVSSTDNREEKQQSIKEEMPLKQFQLGGNKETLSSTFTGPPHSETKYHGRVPTSSRHGAAVSPPVIDTPQFYPTMGVPNHFMKAEHVTESTGHLLSVNRPYHMSLSPNGSGNRKLENGHLSDCRCVSCQSKTVHLSLEKSPARSPLTGHMTSSIDRQHGLAKPYGSSSTTSASHFHKSVEHGSVSATVMPHFHRSVEGGTIPALQYHRSPESGPLPVQMQYHRSPDSGPLPIPATLAYHRPTESGSMPVAMPYHRSAESRSMPVAIPYHKSPENLKSQDMQRLSAPTYFPPAVMPLTISTSPQGHASRYPYIAQLVPSIPPIPSPKEYQNQQLSPIPASYKERFYQHMATSPKEALYQCPPVPSHSSQDVWKQNMDKTIYRKEAVSLRPSSVPMEQPAITSTFSGISSTWKKPDSAPVLDLSLQKPPFLDQRTDEDQPLDLSYSKSSDHEYNQSKPSEQETWLPPKTQSAVNTHLRYLEKSVDKYCQNPRPLPGVHGNLNTNQLSERYASVNDPARSKVTPSPVHEQNIPTSQHANQPYSNHLYQNSVPLSYQSHMHSVPCQTGHVTSSKPNTLLTNVPTTLSKPSNNGNSTPRSENLAKQTRRAGVSKHEPIQNIIGHHNPADILYLICRLCDQTYGSPYGFRKHFRNQHGFEPRADHTIVQTISATKTALRNPIETVANQSLQPVSSSAQPSSNRFVAPLDEKNVQRFKSVLTEKLGVGTKPNSDKNVETYPSQPNVSQHHPSRTVENKMEDNFNFSSSKPSEIRDGEERKCLICPECHQAFQLNDFGSYKRHCRQHSHSRYPGPFQCTECSLSFSEHHLYKEHVAGHYTSCKQCNINFASAAFLHEHIQAVHPETLLLNSRNFDSHNDNLPPKNHENISEQSKQTVLANVDQLAEKSQSLISHFDPADDRARKIIPSLHVQKLPAESATISASPDSSSEVVSTTSCGDAVSTVDSVAERTNQTSVESRGHNSADSDISGEANSHLAQTSSNDNSAISKTVLKKDSQASNIETSSQNSSDSFSLADPDNSQQHQISYKHKKFCTNRKRKDSMPTLGETTSIKSPKLSSSGNESESSLGVESMKSMMDYEPVESSRENCVLSKESDTDSLSESGHEGDRTDDDSKNSKLILKIKCGSGNNNNNNSVKNEARHQLPFVWDRITRRQAGKNIRPPKYH